MIPKKLIIKGLYSYAEEATIDFDLLSQAHIFGIFGNVGSGKSAILEAMMLALYGEVPRLNKNDNRNYNMMNLKSSDLCVDFEFEAGGKAYKIVVEAKRNPKKSEDVKLLPQRRFEWDKWTETWQPNNFDTVEAIGLKLEHFTKTIIVPQNQFQEFLQLKDTERSKMMSDLFNLERFDLAKKATSLENKNKLKLSEVQIQLDQIGDVTAAKIQDIETQIADLERLTANDSILIKEKQQAANEAEQLKKQFETLAKSKNRLDELQKQAPQYNALEKQLSDYEYCQIHFQNLMEQTAKASKSVAENQQLLTQKQGLFSENERLLEETKTLNKSLRPAYDTRHTRLREADELSLVLTIQKAVKTVVEKTKQVEMGLDYAHKKRLEINQLKEKRTTIEAERLTLKSPDVLELQSVKDWFSKFNTLNKETENLDNQVAKLTESLTTIETNHRRLVTVDLPFFGENYPLSISLAETILALKKGIQNKESAKLASNKKMQHELAVLEVENLAATLVEGAPCPLCGSVHHPEVMNATDLHRVVAAIEKEISALELALKSLKNIENQIETLHTNSTKVQQDRRVLSHQIADKRAEIQAHEATFHWKDFSKTDETAVNTAFSDADATLKRIDFINKNIQELNKNIEKETGVLSQYEEKINRLQSEIAVENGQKQTLETQLQTLNFADFTDVSEINIAKKQVLIRQEVKDLEQQFENIEKKVEERAKKADILRGSLLELERNKLGLESELLTAKTALESRLAASDFPNIEAVQTILAVERDVESNRQRLNAFRADSLAAQKAHDELAKELANENYSVENHQALIIEIQELNEKIEADNRYIGGQRAIIADLNLKLKRRKTLEKERDVLDARSKNITIIKNMFRGNAFVSFASTVLLDNLCKTANERFQRLTNHRLSLEIGSDNTFLVRDMMNDGQTRHVKTLSGGQTFQAALSLALALADNIQSLTRSPQNFFFLDEGFGSLDKDSLQIVFDTLKSLRKENRVVGVISHVEEMQQEIERYVRVVLDEEKGSQLSYF